MQPQQLLVIELTRLVDAEVVWLNLISELRFHFDCFQPIEVDRSERDESEEPTFPGASHASTASLASSSSSGGGGASGPAPPPPPTLTATPTPDLPAPAPLLLPNGGIKTSTHSQGAIPKSISFDKTAERGDKVT